MSDRIFLDTNVFIYAAGRENRAKQKIADRLIGEAITRGNGVVSYQVVQEFFNVALKKFTTPFSVDQAQRFLSVTFRPMFAVTASLGLYSDACEIYARYKLSWYDSLIVAAAVEARCSILCTEDLRHGAKISGVKIENPFAVL